MRQTADSLRRWEIPNLARFEHGRGGLVRLAVATRLASAHIYLHGAHVTHFQPARQTPVLFMSESSHFAPGKPIRGGVPVIFPWFGPRAGHPDAPMHGFARTMEWEVESVESWVDQVVTVVLRLAADEQTHAAWPHDFVLRHRITIGHRLEMALEVENWSGAPLVFEEALHTYLAVRDVQHVTVAGLDGGEYLDKTDAFRRKTQEAGPIRLAAETDRIYLHTRAACLVSDPAADRRLRVEKDGSDTTVLWNPWIEKAAALADFGNDEWPQMLCVETANAAENAVTLAHGETHVMRATVGVE
jgi:glucose-6-phosphate 1-epimerase